MMAGEPAFEGKTAEGARREDEGGAMSPGTRCDEILRLIDEVLEDATVPLCEEGEAASPQRRLPVRPTVTAENRPQAPTAPAA